MGAVKVRGVYAIRCVADSRIYVGSSIDTEKRWSQHRSGLNRGASRNGPLQAAWVQYGPDAFTFAVLEEVPPSGNLFEAEQRWIEKHRSEGGLFNLQPNAASPAGIIRSPETRAKIAAALTGHSGCVGERNGRARLTAAAVSLIRQRAAEGFSGLAIAEQFGVSAKTVSHVITRRTWASVSDASDPAEQDIAA